MTNSKIQLDLSGKYIGSGFDIHDGPFSGNSLEISLDKNCADIAPGYVTYRCRTLSADGVEIYRGSILANGNQFAMNFKNVQPGQETDHGVLFGTVTHDFDEAGQCRTVMHNLYYQPEYQGGGYGSATLQRA